MKTSENTQKLHTKTEEKNTIVFQSKKEASKLKFKKASTTCKTTTQHKEKENRFISIHTIMFCPTANKRGTG